MGGLNRQCASVGAAHVDATGDRLWGCSSTANDRKNFIEAVAMPSYHREIDDGLRGQTMDETRIELIRQEQAAYDA
ncbi:MULTISPECIES: hypothetical protein [Methylobacteriaceae]|uniref:hypothetical protein n=1 Tax=Methylobacteriaceae TaxID=119045 RepID=UPI002F35BAB9